MTDNLNGHIRNLREKAYKEQADALFFKTIEEAARNNIVPNYTGWLALKDTIRNIFPYNEI